jgi:hypothetical protein
MRKITVSLVSSPKVVQIAADPPQTPVTVPLFTEATDEFEEYHSTDDAAIYSRVVSEVIDV